MDPTLPIHVDARSATPLYDQIASQMKHAVATGNLRGGDALPSVRQLAMSLRINPNTVARAYRDLEAEGVVETRHGRGTFVARGEHRQSASARKKALGPSVERLAAEAHVAGISPDELATLVKDAATRFASARGTPPGGRRP